MQSRKGRLFPAGGRLFAAVLLVLGGVLTVCLAYGQDQGKTSYMKVDFAWHPSRAADSGGLLPIPAPAHRDCKLREGKKDHVNPH
jgi:hypothetical protein